MTRKHFVSIAKAISENTMSEQQKRELALELLVPFKKANPSFDYPRFLSACLVEVNND